MAVYRLSLFMHFPYDQAGERTQCLSELILHRMTTNLGVLESLWMEYLTSNLSLDTLVLQE